MYEFDADEDEVIARLAVSMSNVGFMSMVAGMLTLLQTIFTAVLAIMVGFLALGILSIASTVIQVTIAGLMISAGRILLAIVRTEGDDMGHLMRGMSRITTIFVLQIVITLVALGIVVWLGIGAFS